MEGLKAAGFQPVAQGKGHVKLVGSGDGNQGEPRAVLLPYLHPAEDLAIGTLDAILEQAGLERQELNALIPLKGTGRAR